MPGAPAFSASSSAASARARRTTAVMRYISSFDSPMNGLPGTPKVPSRRDYT